MSVWSCDEWSVVRELEMSVETFRGNREARASAALIGHTDCSSLAC